MSNRSVVHTWYAQGLDECLLDPAYLSDGEKFTYVSCVYLHGVLEDLAGFDLLSVITKLNQEPVVLIGNYTVTVKIGAQNHTAIAFIWNHKKRPSIHIGFLVSPDDADAVAHAREKFNAKALHI